jgi:MSHA biogenesis protein MshM
LLLVVLFGQPELDAKLAQADVRQLTQRISFHYDLKPLSKNETEYYVLHRFQVAGYMGDRLFHRRAIDLLYRATRGVPRLINVVAHKAMLTAYGEGVHYVYPRHVVRAVRDTPSAQAVSRWPRAAAALALAAGVALVLWYALS